MADTVKTKQSWLSAVIEEAERKARTTAYPTPQEEEWRRTDVMRLAPLLVESETAETTVAKISIDIPEQARDAGVAFELIQAPDAAEKSDFKGLITTAFAHMDNRFQFDNLAKAGTFGFLTIPENVELSESINVDFSIPKGNSAPFFVVQTGERSRSKIVLSLKPDNAANAVLSQVLYGLGNNSSLEVLESHPEIQQHVHHSFAEIGTNARLNHYLVSKSGKFRKARTEVLLRGEGAQADLKGIFVVSDGQHSDIRTVQRHAFPNGTSRSNYRGAVSGFGRNIYQGLIEVQPDAKQSDAYLSNKNLLLNNGARADSIPSLQIKNNDVRCSHGSTTGKIPAEELFYLQARGFSTKEARNIIVEGHLLAAFSGGPEDFAEKAKELL